MAEQNEHKSLQQHKPEGFDHRKMTTLTPRTESKPENEGLSRFILWPSTTAFPDEIISPLHRPRLASGRPTPPGGPATPKLRYIRTINNLLLAHLHLVVRHASTCPASIRKTLFFSDIYYCTGGTRISE